MRSICKYAEFVARILLVVVFLISGTGKIEHYAGTQAYMQSHGVPGALLPLVILTELGGGIAIVLGLYTRQVAFLMAGFCVLAALFFHHDFSHGGQEVNFLKDLAIAGGFLVLAVHGAGELSLDQLWRRH